MSNLAKLQPQVQILHGKPVNRELFDQVMTPNYAPMDLIPSHGRGSRLWDVAGKAYLDFAGGIAVSALGHANPALIDALADQAGKFWHVSNLLTNIPALTLASRLCEATFADKVFLVNSGSEANEAALKLARRYAVDQFGDDKYEILAFENAFHGRTLFTVSVGGQPAYSSGFGPKPAGVSHLPFNDTEAVRKWFEDNGERACAVILEPCQGEGGVIPATYEFVSAIRDFCSQNNALMIFDEVQTGVGRSGALYAYQKLGVIPDILTTAKALGCGFPISAMLTTNEVGSHLVVGSHGSTFGGNPMACAVACKVLDIINTPAILHNVADRSQQLISGLEFINNKHGIFHEIRGLGLLLGCELTEQYSGKARDLLSICTETGLLTLIAGANVLRLAPPLNISEAEVKEGLKLLDMAITRLLEIDKAEI